MQFTHAKEDDQNAEGKIDIILKLDAEILDAAKEEDFICVLQNSD